MHAGKGEITVVHYCPLDLFLCPFPHVSICVEKQHVSIVQRDLEVDFKTCI